MKIGDLDLEEVYNIKKTKNKKGSFVAKKNGVHFILHIKSYFLKLFSKQRTKIVFL